MKIRKGFVSNSSSSSFICDVTGADFDVGYVSYEECGVASCVKGHNFETSPFPKAESWLESEEAGEDARYEVPEDVCPICTGEAKPQIVQRLKREMTNLNITPDDLK